MPQITIPESAMTVEEIAARVGAVPLWRIRTDPAPGTATEDDVERIRAVEKRSCELIDGILVEKVLSEDAALLAMEIAWLLGDVVRKKHIGWVFGPDGFVWINEKQLRAPDVSFVRREQRPHGIKSQGYSHGAPALAVEVISPGNTIREIQQKRDLFLAAGTELHWIVYPKRQEIEVATNSGERRVLTRNDILDGGTVLPKFAVNVGEIFDAIKD